MTLHEERHRILLVVGERAQPRHGHTRGLVRAEHDIRRHTQAVVAFATGHTNKQMAEGVEVPGCAALPSPLARTWSTQASRADSKRNSLVILLKNYLALEVALATGKLKTRYVVC